MNGLGHYVKAQELLAEAEKDKDRSPGPDPRVVQAQVHATLAVAAATALGHNLPSGDKEAWVKEVSVVMPPGSLLPPEDPGQAGMRVSARPGPSGPDGAPAGQAQRISPERWPPPQKS